MIGTIVTPPFNYEEWGWFFEIYLKKGEGADFSHKKDGIVKIGCFFIEEGGVSHIFLRVFGVCVCVCFFFFIYTISISLLCISQKEFSFTESNQQTYDFYKWVIFEKQRLWNSVRYAFDISKLFIQYNTQLLWVHNSFC